MSSRADLAFAALRAGDDARALFTAAIAADPSNPQLRIGEAEARFAAGETEPWACLDPLLAAQPEWLDGQNLRAALRWEGGWGPAFADGFRTAIARRPDHAGLWNAYITILAGVGDHDGAANAAHDAQARFDAPILRLIEASHAGLAGDVPRADRLLMSLPEDLPGRALVDVRQALRHAKFDTAESLLATARNESPADFGTWALFDIVWRLLDDARADWLSRQEGLIATVELPLSSGDIEELSSTLRTLHRQRAQPVGQSVRGGTQTRGPLFDRRDPAIQHLHRAIQDGVDRYRANLPGHDDEHPLLRHRDRRLLARGGWSVRLQGSGHHVSHIHPGGILSSACYLVVPALDAETQEGWLELGAPPRDLMVDLPPLAIVEPKPGRLVLFPSYLYHGTRPFGAGERLTVAFDAVAEGRSAV
ncbi:MAG: hypothetical protein J0I47_02935 [Sphingomonas sp.]|uniref:putative 2OG-Fe(II) oxygenase n=1 Tax=Sphingomonas sp. TaxID=28214 RepID=UPI001AD3000D|nr:putative 2OG-Fe(II) oxygenase [Sphingomonas sp.]MBN8807181.1 hypothetical protein [Sphingomonas sp.]